MFAYYINVPLNDKGIEEFEQYCGDMPNVKTFLLSENEYNFLRAPKGIFEEFDRSFGTIIDVCEEERLDIEQIDVAIKLVEMFISRTKDEDGKNALETLYASLLKAKESGTFWEIDVCLK